MSIVEIERDVQQATRLDIVDCDIHPAFPP